MNLALIGQKKNRRRRAQGTRVRRCGLSTVPVALVAMGSGSGGCDEWAGRDGQEKASFVWLQVGLRSGTLEVTKVVRYESIPGNAKPPWLSAGRAGTKPRKAGLQAGGGVGG